MKPGQHDLLRKVEDHHWWYDVQRRLALDVLRRHVRAGAAVLDAGCGTGGMLSRLGRYAAFGCDRAEEAVRHCRQRGLRRVLRCSVDALPWVDASFDAVLSLDVLYHEAVNEAGAVEEALRVLRPGGILVVHAPALECLRGAHDEAVGGARRYSVTGLHRVLSQAGFGVEEAYAWNVSLLPLLWMRRRWARHPAGDLALQLPGWLAACLKIHGRLDARVCRWLSLSLGTSVMAVARRPN